MAKNISKMMADINPQMERKHTVVNLLNNKDKNKDNGWVSARMAVKNPWKTQTKGESALIHKLFSKALKWVLLKKNGMGQEKGESSSPLSGT